MQILPLKFIHDDDKNEVGVNLFNLARLNHLGLPVVESVIVVPPVQLIESIIEKYSLLGHDLVSYSGSLKQEILRLKTPEILDDFHTNYTLNNKNTFNLNIDKLWQNLLEKWSFELITKIERGEKNLKFTPQQVIFSSSFSKLGTAFFDEDKKHVVIEVENGEIDFKKSEEIENLVQKGNEKLFFPQVFYWVIEDGMVKVIKVAPFSQPAPSRKMVSDTAPQIFSQRNLPKTATKLLLDYSGDVLFDLSVDTVLLRIENPDIEKIVERIDKISKFRDSTIIFFPEFLDSLEQNLEFAKSFIFFKNKKKLDCQIVLPQTFSVDEFLNLKRQFAGLGIYSKGSLKIWKQFLTASDFINVGNYIDAGFDGAVIDLDKAVELITGIDANLFLSEPHLDLVNSVETFFKDLGFTKLIKSHKQVLVTGKSINSEELLTYFIKSGVWGVACKQNTIDSQREHISFLEKTIGRKSSDT